jgi:hypothetical protein
MNNRRLIQALIPLLYGLFIGIFIGWGVETWVPGPAHAAAWRYLWLFGIAALLLASFLILRTGYTWPWENPAERVAAPSTKAYLRNLVPWLVVVVLLFGALLLFQPGFR